MKPVFRLAKKNGKIASPEKYPFTLSSLDSFQLELHRQTHTHMVLLRPDLVT